jgi:putative pyruvate formate lyase activating enzyme
MKRYNQVLSGKPARRVILKSIGADVSYKSRSDELLLKHHDFLMVKYRKFLKEGGPLPKKPDLAPSLLDVKVELANRMLSNCRFCERRCGINRFEKAGACGCDAVSHVASEFMHTGEEPDLIPSHTIFFEGCNFNCAYCQNWSIARMVRGAVADPEHLAKLIEMRRKQGTTNVNFVGGDPTPHLHTILKVVNAMQGNLPVIWNSNMYMTPESMKLLEGVVDLYLADFRYGFDDHAKRYSGVDYYWLITTQNFLEAKKQAEILVRLLVLPGHVECCAWPIMRWCAENLGKDIRFNLMFQYHPEYQAGKFPEINRRLTAAEVARARELAQKAGLKNLV